MFYKFQFYPFFFGSTVIKLAYFAINLNQKKLPMKLDTHVGLLYF